MPAGIANRRDHSGMTSGEGEKKTQLPERKCQKENIKGANTRGVGGSHKIDVFEGQ